MIRLAVVGGENGPWAEAALRLREATIVMKGNDSGEEPSVFLAPTDCEAVVFAGTGTTSPNSVRRCLAAGKHVLLTVDAGLSSETLLELSSHAVRTGWQLALVNPDRFLPSRQLIRQQLDAGKLGQPGLIRLHRWEFLPQNAEEISEALPQPLVRDLDVTQWLMGRFPEVVFALEQQADKASGERGRLLQVHLGFSEVGMALIDYTNRLPAGAPYHSLSLIGSSGAAHADDHQNMQLAFRGGHPLAVRMDEQKRQWSSLLQDFVNGLQAGRDFSSGVASWRRALDTAYAVKCSLQSGKAVSGDGC